MHSWYIAHVLVYSSGNGPAALFLIATHALLLRVMRCFYRVLAVPISLLAWLAVGLQLGASFEVVGIVCFVEKLNCGSGCGYVVTLDLGWMRWLGQAESDRSV